MSEQSVTEMPAETGAGHESSGEFEATEDGQRGPHGLGQSKSSRRRRRKRKGRGPETSAAGEVETGGGDAGNEAGEGHGAVHLQGEAATAQTTGGFAAARQQNARQAQAGSAQNAVQSAGQPGNGQNGNAPGGTKRWKKKFRERNGRFDSQNGGGQALGGYAPQQSGNGFRGPDTHQPGNGGSFKRKGFGKQQGQQRSGGSRSGFVGPMDHSYRAVNGNVFDAGASTVENQGGGRSRAYQGDSQPIDYSQGRAVPIAPGTPTRIYFFIDDLFFTAKISETARKLGVKVSFLKNEKDQLAVLTSGEEETRPALIVFDLNNANAKPMTLIPKLRTKLKRTVSIVGFLSTLQGELRAKAVEAGCDTVMPRAAFSQNLPNLLRRYGIEETEEQQNFNQ